MTSKVTFELDQRDRTALMDLFLASRHATKRCLAEYFFRYQFILLLVSVLLGAWKGLFPVIVTYAFLNVVVYIAYGGKKGLERKFAEKMSQEVFEYETVREKRTVEVTTNTLNTDDRLGRQCINWQGIDSVEILEDSISFFIQNNPAVFVPKRVFEDEKQWDMFCRYAKGCWKKQRGQSA